ncbi:MAG: ROK family protein, partial [Draconibacterium sp.]|nr:ROK family protein [Draconibacterium sp.]
MKKRIAVGIDIGGSHITCQLFNLNTNRLIEGSKLRVAVDSGDSKNSILESWVDTIRQTISKRKISEFAGIGFAMPGPFDYKNGIALFDKNVLKFQKLNGVDVRAEIIQRLGLPSN